MSPSKDFAPYAKVFIQCVQYSVAIHLFIRDVIEADDTEEHQLMDLETLIGMMTEHKFDMSFIQCHGSVMFDLLRDLTMSKKYKFMIELSKMRPLPGDVRPSFSGAAPESISNTFLSGSKQSRGFKSTAKSAHPTLRAGVQRATEGTIRRYRDGNLELLTKESLGIGEQRAGFGEEAGKWKKRRQRRKDGSSEPGAGVGSSWTSSTVAPPSIGQHAEAQPPQNCHSEDEALLTLPGCRSLHLSPEVSKILNTMTGHNHRLTLAIEQQRTNEAVEKQLKVFEGLLKDLSREGYHPLHYLLSGTQGGEAFFLPLFDLYRLLKRVRLTCSEDVKPRVAVLRRQLVKNFTDPVLRDIWYIQNRGSVREEIRALKDAKKGEWLEAKFKRLSMERAEIQERKATEKKLARTLQEQRRKERAIRRQEWEDGHAERKEARRAEKVARKAAAQALKLHHIAAGEVAPEGGEKKQLEVEDTNSLRGEKRAAVEETGSERASKRGDTSSACSTCITTDDSTVFPLQRDPTTLATVCKGGQPQEESKCTLSPMIYVGRAASTATGTVKAEWMEGKGNGCGSVRSNGTSISREKV